MNKAFAALASAILLSPAVAAAATEPGLEPLAFLAGHCWKGTMPNGTDTDEHCFAWVYEGRYLRDKHVVRSGEKAVYEGETIYYWNAAARQVEYLYITAHGGHALGRMVPEAEALAFPAAVLVTAAKPFGFRGRWKRLGDDAYEVLREYETEKGWMPVTMRMQKVVR